MNHKADGENLKGEGGESPRLPFLFVPPGGPVRLATSDAAGGLPFSGAENLRQLAMAPALIRRSFLSGRRSASDFCIESVNRLYVRLAMGR